MSATKEQCIDSHKRLHSSLDELVACFISSEEYTKKGGLEGVSVMDLMKWSFEQTKEPDCFKQIEELAAQDEAYDKFQQISDDYLLDALSEKLGEDGEPLLSDNE